MPRKSPSIVILTNREREELQERARAYTLPYFQVIRAKLILMAASGLSNDVIASRLDLGRDVISLWRKRFCKDRLKGLEDLPRPGRPRHGSSR